MEHLDFSVHWKKQPAAAEKDDDDRAGAELQIFLGVQYYEGTSF